jgi:hypothetical protein
MCYRRGSLDGSTLLTSLISLLLDGLIFVPLIFAHQLCTRDGALDAQEDRRGFRDNFDRRGRASRPKNGSAVCSARCDSSYVFATSLALWSVTGPPTCMAHGCKSSSRRSVTSVAAAVAPLHCDWR